MKRLLKVSGILFKMESRNKQAVLMSILFPVMLMALMGTAGQEADQHGIPYMTFLLPGILGMAYGATGLISLPVMLVSFKERNILKRIVGTPISMINFIISIFITQGFVILLQTVIIMLIAILIFGVELFVSLNIIWLLFPVLVFGTISLLGTGLIISLFTNKSKNASTLGNIINFIMMFLSGAFFPVDTWPKFLHPLIKILPLTYIIEGIRKSLVFQTQTLQTFGIQTAFLVVFSIVTISIAAKWFRWE